MSAPAAGLGVSPLAVAGALLRVGPALLLLPVARLGVRLLAALLVSAYVAASLPLGGAAPWRELLVGTTIGLSAAAPLWAARVAGAALGGAPGARLTGALALVGFGAAGGPRLLVEALARSYLVVPAAGVGSVVDQIAGLFGAALGIAAPLLFALALFELWGALLVRGLPLLPGSLPAPAARLWLLATLLAVSAPWLAARAVGLGRGAAAALAG